MRSTVEINPSREIPRTIAHLARRWQAADTALLRQLFPLLAEGHPVPVTRLAQVTGRDEETVDRALRLGRVDRDSQGRAIELFGIAQRPTRHEVRIGDVILFSCCALVAQMVPSLLGRRAAVRSVDPEGSRLVCLEVSPFGLESVAPRGAVGSLVATSEDEVLADVRSAFCDHVCLFPNREAAAEFVRADPKRYVVEIGDFYAASQRLRAAVWGRGLSGASGFPSARLLTPRLIK